jgi:hypothetical protein
MWQKLELWQKTLAVFLGLIAVGLTVGKGYESHAQDHSHLSTEQQALTSNVKALVDWQQSEEKRLAEEAAKEAEKTRIRECFEQNPGHPERCVE